MPEFKYEKCFVFKAGYPCLDCDWGIVPCHKSEINANITGVRNIEGVEYLRTLYSDGVEILIPVDPVTEFKE